MPDPQVCEGRSQARVEMADDLDALLASFGLQAYTKLHALPNRLARQARKGFRSLVEERKASGDGTGALAAATRWAALEPLEDEAQHTLIALLADSVTLRVAPGQAAVFYDGTRVLGGGWIATADVNPAA